MQGRTSVSARGPIRDDGPVPVNETALILPVPAAEPLVSRFRAKYDSSAASGVPAHVTLLYPFLEPGAVSASDVAALTTLFASTPAIDAVFARCGRFEPRVLYLAPEPQAEFLALMRRVWERWPDVPPYAGTIPADVVRPHLTVSDSVTGDHLARIELGLAGQLPLATRLAEAHLIENRTGLWTTRQSFPLGA
jgi:2'-5' RNA ligase